MAQHDYVLDNASGATFRADLNDALAAIVSANSGATAPGTTFAYQWWVDTSTGLLKQRNAANTAWITIGTLASTNWGLIPTTAIGSSVQAYDADTAKTDVVQAWDADAEQTLDGTQDAGSLDALGSDTYTVELGTVTELDGDVDGTIAAPSSGYGFAVTHIYNNGTRSITLSGFPTDALNGGTLSGTDTKIDILITERASVNGSDIINHWIFNRA